MPNSGRKWDSLITAETSLIARFNSLHGRKKFPVRMRRELARKKLISCPFSLLPRRCQAPNRRNSLYLVLLVGFAAALRPSEISGLMLTHVARHADGIELFLPWRKNDQDAR